MKTVRLCAQIEGMSPHDRRHTYATLAVKSNAQPEVLQEILGHASYTATIKYDTHLDQDFVPEGSKQFLITGTLQTPEDPLEKSEQKSCESQ